MSAIDFAGDTALHDAARFGHAGIVKALLECGADCAVINKEGFSALKLARHHGKADVVAILEEHIQSELAAVAQARRESFLLGGKPVAFVGCSPRTPGCVKTS